MGQRDGAMTYAGNGFPAPPTPHRAPRADPVAAAILLIAGAIGIWQLLLPWRTTSPGRRRIRHR